MEAPSSAYPGGMLVVGKSHQEEEETSCDATPNSTRRPVASSSMPAPCLSASCTRPVRSCFTAPGKPVRACVSRHWRADLCAPEQIPCVLGHALSMTAFHGGQATTDQSDAQKITGLLRGARL